MIYTARATGPGEQILLVIESRSTALRRQCERRLQTAKLPPLATLTIAFKADAPPDASPESVHASCRRQVTLAAEIRRELRPAMR